MSQKKELTLLIMYINGWEEDSRLEKGEKIFRVWKGYPFDILNELEIDGAIRQFGKSVVMTREGIAKAEALKDKYLYPKNQRTKGQNNKRTNTTIKIKGD